jgi:uncharacterized membrane protein HdeD (DUF308 family)
MTESSSDTPTVGYLVAGLIQLALGAGLVVANFVGSAPASSIFGLFLLFLGIRTVVKYRARTRRRR